ncbi:acyltransferase [Desulfonema ishimotonii]|uniref:Acyltransferase n=1 Tax=Desulfonema ishimotonii TaxID=45657 RepID=A0A401G214_9BACT|nr:acyltransferase [Desulfonema ishimotonii]GBC63257.1 acyltransferase [Desulfonema ishimotonii]
MRSKNIAYLPELDHIRAYAAILIILYHGLHLISYKLMYDAPFAFDHWPRTGNPLAAVLIEGHTAVALFMVLSGFIFTFGTYDRSVSYGKFIRNRILRTYPLFIVLLFVGIYSYPQHFSFASFLQTLFALANANNGISAGSFSAMFWTIAVEWQFYLIFPLLLLILNDKGAKSLAGIILVFLLMRLLSFLGGANIRDVSYWTIIGRIDQFLVGMLTAIFYKKYFSPGRWWRLSFLPAVVLLCLMMYLFHRQGGWPGNYWWKIAWPTLEALVWGVFIISYSAVSTGIPRCVSRPISYVGTISYSLYLIHFVVIDSFIRHDLLISFSDARPIWTALIFTALIILPIVIFISAITYTFIEKPFLDMRVSYKR